MAIESALTQLETQRSWVLQGKIGFVREALRYVGAVLLGLVYAIVIQIGLGWGIQNLLSEQSEEAYFSHYVLLAICWCAAVFVGAAIAASAVRNHRAVVSVFCALPFPLFLIYFLAQERVWDSHMPVFSPIQVSGTLEFAFRPRRTRMKQFAADQIKAQSFTLLSLQNCHIDSHSRAHWHHFAGWRVLIGNHVTRDSRG